MLMSGAFSLRQLITILCLTVAVSKGASASNRLHMWGGGVELSDQLLKYIQSCLSDRTACNKSTTELMHSGIVFFSMNEPEHHPTTCSPALVLYLKVLESFVAPFNIPKDFFFI